MTQKKLVALVVDDEKGTREIIQRSLKNAGIFSIGASDPIRALQIIEDNHKFDLIVTDYQMPHLNGREFIAKLSEIGHKGSLPLIMVSGMVSLKEINDIMGSGVEFFLPKPLNMNDFAHYVELYRQRYLLAQSVSTN